MGLLFGTCGVCFCPLMCYGLVVDVEAKANNDIDALPITKTLQERGIAVHFHPKTSKFDMGGMNCTLSASTPPAPPVQQMDRQVPVTPAAAESMEVIVPDGVAAGQAIVVTVPGGAMMQTVVPAGLRPGEKFMITVAKN